MRRVNQLVALGLLALPTLQAFKFLQGDLTRHLKPKFGQKKLRKEAQDKFGEKKVVVVTGASGTLGRNLCRDLLETGEYHVVAAARDPEKVAALAAAEGWGSEEGAAVDAPPGDSFTALRCELGSFQSVRDFCAELADFMGAKSLDQIVCSAATYVAPQSSDDDDAEDSSVDEPGAARHWSEDGHELTVQTNFLSHFLMLSLLMPTMARSADPRIVLVGSEGCNDLTA